MVREKRTDKEVSPEHKAMILQYINNPEYQQQLQIEKENMFTPESLPMLKQATMEHNAKLDDKVLMTAEIDQLIAAQKANPTKETTAALQKALSNFGLNVQVDGVDGPQTKANVQAFNEKKEMFKQAAEKGKVAGIEDYADKYLKEKYYGQGLSMLDESHSYLKEMSQAGLAKYKAGLDLDNMKTFEIWKTPKEGNIVALGQATPEQTVKGLEQLQQNYYNYTQTLAQQLSNLAPNSSLDTKLTKDEYIANQGNNETGENIEEGWNAYNKTFNEYQMTKAQAEKLWNENSKMKNTSFEAVKKDIPFDVQNAMNYFTKEGLAANDYEAFQMVKDFKNRQTLIDAGVLSRDFGYGTGGGTAGLNTGSKGKSPFESSMDNITEKFNKQYKQDLSSGKFNTQTMAVLPMGSNATSRVLTAMNKHFTDGANFEQALVQGSIDGTLMIDGKPASGNQITGEKLTNKNVSMEVAPGGAFMMVFSAVTESGKKVSYVVPDNKFAQNNSLMTAFSSALYDDAHDDVGNESPDATAQLLLQNVGLNSFVKTTGSGITTSADVERLAKQNQARGNTDPFLAGSYPLGDDYKMDIITLPTLVPGATPSYKIIIKDLNTGEITSEQNSDKSIEEIQADMGRQFFGGQVYKKNATSTTVSKIDE